MNVAGGGLSECLDALCSFKLGAVRLLKSELELLACHYTLEQMRGYWITVIEGDQVNHAGGPTSQHLVFKDSGWLDPDDVEIRKAQDLDDFCSVKDGLL